ncbi:MAG: HNH endonuclease [Coriobacteriia bacterium]
MCHPRNDLLIVELLECGKLVVDGTGCGRVFIRDEQTGMWRPVAERVEQAGRRPAAPEYRKFVIRWQGRVRSLRVHRVVWVAFNGPTPLEIDHIDDDTMNCGLKNLQALGRFDNQAKAREAAWWRLQGGGDDENR